MPTSGLSNICNVLKQLVYVVGGWGRLGAEKQAKAMKEDIIEEERDWH